MKKVAVIGAGTMGNGIAHIFAVQGFKVELIDQNRSNLEKAVDSIEKNLERQLKRNHITQNQKGSALKNIGAFSNLDKINHEPDLMIEAIFEKFEAKANLFQEADQLFSGHTIFASNTSSISITRLAAVTNRPQKVIGMHFMNPVPVMKLVEVINGHQTSAEVTRYIVEVCRELDKIPVAVKDYPGFVSNRILMPMINEAIFTLFEGVAGISEIDTVMKLGMAHPMGPLQLADYIGLDVCLSILNVLHEGFQQPKYAPCPLLKNLIYAGNLGRKTGRGFYDWSDPENPVAAF
jgi:3-hydroxybutyryl-CoA dehydrogenase